MRIPGIHRAATPRALVLALAATALAIVTPAPAAEAGSSCIEPLCSTIENRSTLGVYIGRDWTCSGGTTGTARGESCVSTSNRRWLPQGSTTPAWQDWDSFRVDAGYCYRVHFILPYDSWTQNDNRSGMTTPVWVKVEDHAIARIQAQQYGSCP